MSTIQENLLPSAMVPGLVTIEDKDGKRQNVYPVDAKELIQSGEYTLVENGAVEAARMAATPLRSGMASGIPDDQIIAEISGIEGRIVAASTPEAAKEAIEAGNSPDAKPSGNAPKSAPEQAREQEAASAAVPKTDVEKEQARKNAETPARFGDKPADKPTGKAGADQK